MFKKLIIASSLLPLSAMATSNDVNFLNFSSQAQYKAFAEDLSGSLAQKTLIPAEPLGITGFDLGVSYNLSNLKNKQMAAVSLQPKSSMDTVSVHAVKGLPFGIDLGVDYTNGLNNTSTLGGSLSYAILDGTLATPALNIKGFYNQSNGMKAVDFTSYGAEVGISKGFANLTPFAAVGMVSGEVKPSTNALFNTSSVTLKSENVSLVKYAVGLNINLFLMDVLVGYNQIGDVTTYSLKAGYRF